MAERDFREDAQVKRLLTRLPRMEHAPLVTGADLVEVLKVLQVLPELKFPINSGGQLIAELGGAGQRYDVVGVTMSPLRMIKYMPAHYFPIASMENFVEKLAELINQNRPQIDVQAELTGLRRQLPELKFPIASPDELLDLVGSSRRYRFRGGSVRPGEIVKRIPPEMFPIESQVDFNRKIAHLIRTIPLIVAD